jgi:hypothetical protein
LEFFRGKYLANKVFQHFVLFDTPICVGFLDGDAKGSGSYGAGDGNRIHVRSLGGWPPATIARADEATLEIYR